MRERGTEDRRLRTGAAGENRTRSLSEYGPGAWRSPSVHRLSKGASLNTTRIVERPNYFVGMVIIADDLRQEQEYTRDRERAHNRLHGWGVVSGLEVEATKPGSGRIVVRPGSALDRCGREIVLTESIEIDVPGATASKRPECVYVVIAYGEEEIDRVPVGAGEGELVPTRIREVPTISLVDCEDEQGSHLVLARIDVSKSAKTITARRIDNSVRPVVDIPGQ